MRILMIFYDLQDFGGLEEYALNLAIGLQQQGHNVNCLSAAWVSPSNQYLRRFTAVNIRLVQPWAWISKPVSDWSVKEEILRAVMWLCMPLVLFLGVGVFVFKRRSLIASWRSSYNWLKGQWMKRLIAPDRRAWLLRILLTWWMIRWRPDILHVHDFSNGLLFVTEWAQCRHIPIVYEEHATPDVHFDVWKDVHCKIPAGTVMVAVSEKSADALAKLYNIPHPLVVRGPLLSDPFTPGWRRENNRQNAQGGAIVTTIARLISMKGLDYLLESAALVRAVYPDVHFRIYGDGELRDELKVKACELGLKAEDIFAGVFSTREELSRILLETDIFLLPSILEGQPLVIVEAMAHGCPIVSTAVGGIPELIQHGVNGLLCAPADADCLAENICKLLEEPHLRIRLGDAARISYEQGPFHIAAVTAKFVSIYDDAIRLLNTQ